MSYRWRNWGSETISDLHYVTQLDSKQPNQYLTHKSLGSSPTDAFFTAPSDQVHMTMKPSYTLILFSQFNYVLKLVAFATDGWSSFKTPHNIFHKPPPSSPYNSFLGGPSSSSTWPLSLALMMGNCIFAPTLISSLYVTSVCLAITSPWMPDLPSWSSHVTHITPLQYLSYSLSSLNSKRYWFPLLFFFVLHYLPIILYNFLFSNPLPNPQKNPPLVRVPYPPLSLAMLIPFIPIHIFGCFCTLFYYITTLLNSS